MQTNAILSILQFCGLEVLAVTSTDLTVHAIAAQRSLMFPSKREESEFDELFVRQITGIGTEVADSAGVA